MPSSTAQRGKGVGVPAIRRLKTSDNVRAALAAVYRKVENGDMDLGTARVLIYAAATLAAVMRDTELEARLEALERASLEAGE